MPQYRMSLISPYSGYWLPILGLWKQFCILQWLLIMNTTHQLCKSYAASGFTDSYYIFYR